MARVRIALQRLLHDQRQPIEALAHVGTARRQPHPNPRGDRDHRRVNVLTTRASAVASTSTPTMIRSPPESTISEYAGPPSAFLDVEGIRPHVRDTGPRAAPAVIFLHGFGSSLQTWEDWARELERDHRVIRYDLPGFGLTGPDPSRDYTDARSIAVLVALMDRLGVARASIVGNSMGGRIAWTFAAQNPKRVDKLVLISPDGFASPGLEYGVAPRTPLMMRALPYVLPSFMLRPSLAAAYANPDALFRRYRDMMLAPGVRGAIVDRMSQQVLVDPAPLLARIEAPTLVMWGEKDGMIPFSNSADCLRALPHATLAPLPGIGHLPQEEAPATVRILREFLDR
jgi:pimeloyl-ACP methyl ester carboxylesterase